MKLVVAVVSILLAVSAVAQDDTTFRKLRVVTGDFRAIAVDNLDNLYTVDSRNRLKKFNANGDSVAVYNDVRQFGTATLIDVSNPLKIVLYYQDFATVVELDRFLNPVNVIDLRKSNVFQARAVGQAYDNNTWVYDEADSKLKRIDQQGKILLETPDFRLLLGKAITPLRIFDENRYVYLYDSTHGVYVFDYFGTLRNNILLQNWQNLSVTGRFIFGSKGGNILRYEIRTTLLDEWRMPETIRGSVAFRFSSSRLYALRRINGDQAAIHIYTIH
jgi:hypothetical protein